MTFNHVRGCTKVSDGCKHCYAETLSGRNPGTLGVWGPNGTRVVASEAMWREPLKWDRAAKAALDDYYQGAWEDRAAGYDGPPAPPPERPRVFCASLADVFEDWQGPMKNATGFSLWHMYPPSGTWASNPGDVSDKRSLTMDDVRARLFKLIDATPNLDWLVLTKRPENIARMIPVYFPGGYIAEAGRMNQEGPRPNLWLGTSVENRKTLGRIDALRQMPAAVRFLSCEPLLEDLGTIDLTGIHWVIVGGESGPGARPCNIAWITSLVAQCEAAGVPCFVKQLGSFPTADTPQGWRGIPIKDRKGGDIAEFPEELRVRNFPTPTNA